MYRYLNRLCKCSFGLVESISADVVVEAAEGGQNLRDGGKKVKQGKADVVRRANTVRKASTVRSAGTVRRADIEWVHDACAKIGKLVYI
jgi:hypothetical protein